MGSDSRGWKVSWLANKRQMGVGTVLPWEEWRRRRAYLAMATRRMDVGSGGAVASPPWTPHVCAAANGSELSSLLGLAVAATVVGNEEAG
jgi:hypothetical protein